MAKTLTKTVAIREGLSDFQDALDAARAALEELYACHCCCCTGECTTVFQDSTEEEQAAWLENYWAQYR